ncbi:DUF2970 domain-containing protein [Marinobacter zhejiangensis]|uniref:DUF2970 domain-containing protein n=1 Tax=Marinobacter zhejiangensis TaxID=488535 RepID=A0A1I4RVY0_9GAMM|nr:DUF2970 domain-containing protein [Marinobacter zhejiangensis]SFM56173.1 Protein of unknown function [Marinobacter zhejiangensis]
MTRQATPRNTQTPNSRSPSRPGILKVIQGVLAGALGVQSSKRREEDFSSQSPWPYIITGVVFTVLFVLTLVVVVKLVIP